MAKDLRVGEKVVAYVGRMRLIATIEEFEDDGFVALKGYDEIFHPKQVRRLRPKPLRRERWMNIYEDGSEDYFDSEKCADAMAKGRLRCVRMVEAREKSDERK